MNNGVYGSGIYLNTSAQYSVPHWSNKTTPTIMLCLTLPGYPYPVIEHPASGVLFGKGLSQGHQSHYVLTKTNGEPITEICENYYDELVLDQEGQVLPIFVVEIHSSQIELMQKRFRRQIHTPSVEIGRGSRPPTENPHQIIDVDQSLAVTSGIVNPETSSNDESEYHRW